MQGVHDKIVLSYLHRLCSDILLRIAYTLLSPDLGFNYALAMCCPLR